MGNKPSSKVTGQTDVLGVLKITERHFQITVKKIT